MSIRGISDVIFTLVSYLPPCPTDLASPNKRTGCCCSPGEDGGWGSVVFEWRALPPFAHTLDHTPCYRLRLFNSVYGEGCVWVCARLAGLFAAVRLAR